MDEQGWTDRGVYWVRQLASGWKLSLLVGEDVATSLVHPCDVTLTRPDGSRYYGTFCTSAMLETILRSSRFLAMNSWIAVRTMSVSEISDVVEELVLRGVVETAFEDIGPEVDLDE